MSATVQENVKSEISAQNMSSAVKQAPSSFGLARTSDLPDKNEDAEHSMPPEKSMPPKKTARKELPKASSFQLDEALQEQPSDDGSDYMLDEEDEMTPKEKETFRQFQYDSLVQQSNVAPEPPQQPEPPYIPYPDKVLIIVCILALVLSIGLIIIDANYFPIF